jgi:hypothetical protein
MLSTRQSGLGSDLPVQPSEDIPGYIEAPANAPPTRGSTIGTHGPARHADDLTLHQYMADLAESLEGDRHRRPDALLREVRRQLLGGAEGLPRRVRRRDGRTCDREDTGVLAAADVFTEDVAFQVMQSVRLDLGYGAQVHP